MFRPSIASCRKTAWIMRLHETCKVRNFSCLSRAMSVSRVFLGFAILSWTSWIAADLFISGFPGSRPSRLCRERVRRLSCRRRMFVPGCKSADSINNRPIRAESPGSQLVRFGLCTSNQQDVPMDSRTVMAISAGGFHTCALRSDGQSVCFGWSHDGQCDVPTDLRAVVAVSAGVFHTCAITSDGQLVCFGRNHDGQCDVPTDLRAVVAVSAGSLHTCAMTSDGQLVCFGGNTWGQCDVPTDLEAVVAVSAGSFHTCAMTSYGQLVCFGGNISAWGECDVPKDLEAVVAVSAGESHTRAVQMVNWSALEATPADNAMCRRIWAQFWQSQQAPLTRVQ